ncbi:MAG TPA: potassium/proton antiporter [Gaiellaceae bacterium]|nr:potassium/proton antiporter [Gaiellaceae bacterium]
MSVGLAMLAVGAVLAASVALALGAAKTTLPALVAFLGLGMVLGSDGPGGIAFDDATVAREVGIVSLVAILYEGGLSTSWRRLRTVALPATLLSTVGVAVSAALTGCFAHLLFDLSWAEAFLLGSVVASTDAAAVFATLRRTRLRRGLARTLEAESGGNDPVAIALTLGLIAWIERPHYGLDDLIFLVVKQIGIGLAIGLAIGLLATWVFARIPASIASFVPVASAATAALAFGAADAAQGSGFLSVYLVGLAVGSTPSRYRGQLVTFHEGIAYVAQVALFIVLGLLVFPSHLPHVALAGIGLAAGLMFVARPVAVWASTPFMRFSSRERVLLGWAGLRGGVPIVLGTFVLSSHLTAADTIFDAVFFVVLVSVVLQGTTLEWLAGRLGLVGASAPSQPPLAVSRSGLLDLEEFRVAADHAIAGAAVRELGLPREALVAVVVRDDDPIPPRGSTRIESGDVLFVLVPHGKRAEVEDVFERWRRRV